MSKNVEKKQTPVQGLIQEARDNADLRPIRRRSSILPRVNSDPLEINDDSVERGRARLESAASSSASSPHSRRSLNLAAVAQFTGAQMAAGVAECMKLNAENKITKKNAFSLKMIDFMTYMVKNRDDGMSNLVTASTALDVSTKIYGLRVDVLHQDTLNMAGNLEHESQNAEETSEDPTATPENAQSQAKPKRKKKCRHLLADLESVCGDPEMIKLEPPMLGDGDYQTSDMLLQNTAPRHVGLGLGIHLYNDVLLDTIKPQPYYEAEKVTIKPIVIPEDCHIGEIFREFEFLNWDETYAPDNLVQNWTQQNSAAPVYDLNASVMVDDEEQEEPHLFEDGDGTMVETAPGPSGLRTGNIQGEHLVDANDLLACAPFADEYSFFQDQSLLDIRWKTGGQWTVRDSIRAPGNAPAQRREAGRPKKDFVIDFKAPWTEEMEAKFAPMKRVVRKAKPATATFLMPEKSGAEGNELFKYGIRPDDLDLMPRKPRPSEARPRAALPDDLNLNDTLNDDYIGNHHHDDDDDMGDLLAGPSEPMEHDEIASQGGFIGANLVEAPRLTEKVHIAYSKRAKKLDMRHLKKCIWKSVSGGVGANEKHNKENEGDKQEDEGDKQEDEGDKTGRISFADIYEGLPEQLSANDARDLSFPIAFVSLLHLANEKNLSLTSNEDHSDVIIKMDDE